MNKYASIHSRWDNIKSKLISYIASKANNNSDIEDITQEVFVKFWTKYQHIKDEAKTLNWLFSVAKYTIIDYYRKKENKFYPLFESDTEFEADYSSYSEESKQLIPIINSLPSKYKSILIMADIYDVPHKEIAEYFNLSVSCVKSRAVRARKLLKERMHHFCNFKHDRYGNILSCENKSSYINLINAGKK